MIRHYSFDLWMTLIKSNPTFKNARARYLHGRLCEGGKIPLTIEEIKDIVNQVDVECNARNEMSGEHINALEMYAMVVFRMQGHLKNVSLPQLQVMYNDIKEIFYQYPPTYYDGNTILVLEELKERGFTMSILSNTGFITGGTLLPVLKNLRISNKMMFMDFSDKTGYSKPSGRAFRNAHKQLAYQREEVMHVGDNEDADGIGAKFYGFIPQIINSNSLTIKDLL